MKCCGITMEMAVFGQYEIYRCRHRSHHGRIFVDQNDGSVIHELDLQWELPVEE